MAKKKPDTLRINCAYCKNGGHEAPRGHMYPCSFLEHCVVVDRGACKAHELGKGNFEVDVKKLNEWTLKHSSPQSDKASPIQ